MSVYLRPKSNEMRPINLEQNCNQIFARGPSALTRELFHKMKRSDTAGINNYRFMGYEIKSRHFWALLSFLLLFIFSFTGTILMFFTNFFDNMVFSQLAIIENSESFNIWQRPTPTPYLKIHIFNYTNVEDFEKGLADKLNVKDIGPYIYQMNLERINANFNGTSVSYQEKRTYTFMPDLSHPWKQSDQIVAPNIPMLTAASVSKHSNFLTRIAISSFLKSLDAKPFIHLPVDRFITGYDDSFYSLSKNWMKLQHPRFGLLSSNMGVSEDVYTVDTGASNIDHVTMLKEFNGASKLRHWSTDACNELTESTDGSMFAPKLVRNRKDLRIFVKEMCRSLTLNFKEEVKILNATIPAHRYTLSANIYDAPERTPSNQCFCNMDSGECPLQGVFNATPCSYGAPIFISNPHFRNGDVRLREGVSGLEAGVPYETYVDVHPTLGFAMAGKNRFQVNVQVLKSFGVTQLSEAYEDGAMLPVAWLEMSLEDKTLPDDIVGLIFQTTFTLKSVELGLKWGCLLMAVVTFACVGIAVRNGWWMRSGLTPLERRNGLV